VLGVETQHTNCDVTMISTLISLAMPNLPITKVCFNTSCQIEGRLNHNRHQLKQGLHEAVKDTRVDVNCSDACDHLGHNQIAFLLSSCFVCEQD
jgi:NADH:ubiquinone oxidoreductase subunit E